MKSLLLIAFMTLGLNSTYAESHFCEATCCSMQISQQGKQGRGHFDPVKFRKDLETYITREAGLTQEEAQRFFPVFHKSKMELRRLSKKMALASMRIKKENLTEQQCDQLLVEIEATRKQCAEIQNEATKEWRKILPASKILKIFNAEHNFGKRTFRTMVGKK